MTPITLAEYVDRRGKSPFGIWFGSLNAAAAARITVHLGRLETGNVSSLKSVGDGVHEMRVDWGPGYRIYLAWTGKSAVLLLGGGAMKRQDRDISSAKDRWQEFKARRRMER